MTNLTCDLKIVSFDWSATTITKRYRRPQSYRALLSFCLSYTVSPRIKIGCERLDKPRPRYNFLAILEEFTNLTYV
jgi:hypothetical protein